MFCIRVTSSASRLYCLCVACPGARVCVCVRSLACARARMPHACSVHACARCVHVRLSIRVWCVSIMSSSIVTCPLLCRPLPHYVRQHPPPATLPFCRCGATGKDTPVCGAVGPSHHGASRHEPGRLPRQAQRRRRYRRRRPQGPCSAPTVTTRPV